MLGISARVLYQIHRPMKTHRLVLALVLAAAPLFAQKAAPPPEPPELIASRAEHLRAMSRAQVQPLAAYLRTLEPLKQQFLRAGKSDAAVAVDTEIASIKEQLKAAQAASDITTAAPVQFQLENVMFGDPATKRMKDVTSRVRAALDAGQPTLVLGNRELGGDPAGGVHKTVIVTYTINGMRKTKTLMAGSTLEFKKDLR
jgi:hypothetical protein